MRQALLLFLAVASTAGAATGAPVSTARPTIAGALRVGSRLVASPGGWTAAGTPGYGYQWYRCDASGARCASVRGATGAGYRTVAADAGRTIAVTVKATDGGGTASAHSSLVGPVAAAGSTLYATAPPELAGAALVGQALQAGSGKWRGGAASFAYAWQRCNASGRICAPIAGAVSATYTPTVDDVGHALVPVVTATAGAASAASFGAASAPVAAPPGPRATARPAVTGIAQQGSRLTGTTGGWEGSGTVSYAFQWYRCNALVARCSSIHGATARTYRLVAADVGRTIALTVEATDANGTASGYASALGPVAAAAATTANPSALQPTLTGAAVVGGTLTAGAGSWRIAPTGTAYAWLRCNANGRACTQIAGASAPSYVPTAADAGHVLVAAIQATAGGAVQTALSVGAGPVAAA